jgi:hypothetical protein
VNFNPCLHEAGLVVGEFPSQYGSICNTEDSPVVGILCMDMGNVMLFIIHVQLIAVFS